MKNINFPSKSDPMRKKLIHYFFTGAENISKAEQEEVDALLNSPSVQKEFCDYMIHSSKTIISRLKSIHNKYFRILRKAPWKTPWTSTW